MVEAKTIEGSDFLQKILDTISQPIFFKDNTGKYLGCNKSFEKFHELSKHEILGKTILDIESSKLGQMYYQQDVDLLSKCEVERRDLVFIKNDRVLMMNKNTYLNTDGSVGGLVGVINDITELKENQQQLRESQEQLKVLITSIQDMIFTLNLEGRCTGFYGQWATKAGVLDAEYIGETLHHIFADSYEEFERDIFPKVLAGQDVMYECQLGSVMGGKQAQISLSPIYNENHQIAGVVGVGRDVTVQQMVLEALRESENMYRGLVDTTPYGIILTDISGRIQIVNQQSAFLHNFDDLEEMMGKNFFSLVELEEQKRMQGLFSKVIEKGKAQKAEFSLVKHNGGSFLSEVITSSVLDAQGNPKFFINVERDITEEKSMQEVLKGKNEELHFTIAQLKVAQVKLVQQEKLAGIGQLAAGVAHEINNPLGFVISNYSTLKNYVERLRTIIQEYSNIKIVTEKINDPHLTEFVVKMNQLEKEKKISFVLEDIQDLFKESNDGLERVGKIVTGLRNFARIDQETDFQEYDLNEGIKNTLVVARNELKYCANVEENLGDIPCIEAVGSHINQVLLNIIVNAGQAIKQKQVEALGLVRITTYTFGEFVYCEISDDGVGIAEENKEKIFEAFFTTKPIGQGTGLGLSISHDIIVNKHHGEIILDSTVGLGTVFIMKLPIKQTKQSL